MQGINLASRPTQTLWAEIPDPVRYVLVLFFAFSHHPDAGLQGGSGAQLTEPLPQCLTKGPIVTAWVSSDVSPHTNNVQVCTLDGAGCPRAEWRLCPAAHCRGHSCDGDCSRVHLIVFCILAK